MKIRPWPIVILAAIQILAPLTNIAYSAWVMKISVSRYLALTFNDPHWLSAGTVAFLLSFPIAGVAIYRCNRWSYPVFLAIMGWACYSNFESWHEFGWHFGATPFLLASIANIGIVSYFLIPAVREVYFNPKLRWWEAKPRYDCSFPAKLLGQQGVATNLSEGGIYVETRADAWVGSELRASFRANEKDFVLEARVVRVREAQPRGCGLQFVHTPESLRAVRLLIQELRRAGAQERLGNVHLLKEFKNWALTLLTTGRGLIPPKN